MIPSTRRRHRRTLRRCTSDLLIEATLTRIETNNTVTVEIAGGHAGSTATVLIGGSVANQVLLDACGSGQIDVALCRADERLDIAIGDRVLLSGRLPGTYCAEESRR